LTTHTQNFASEWVRQSKRCHLQYSFRRTFLLVPYHDTCGKLGLSLYCGEPAIWSTGPVVHLFAFRHEGPGFNPQGSTYVNLGFSCQHCLVTLLLYYRDVISSRYIIYISARWSIRTAIFDSVWFSPTSEQSVGCYKNDFNLSKGFKKSLPDTLRSINNPYSFWKNIF
jgi:hypothetical protein